jgi:hypothetical protein
MPDKLLLSRFTAKMLHNRLGQEVDLHLCHQPFQGRDLIFILAPRQASSFVGKNAEPFIFQLREELNLDPNQIDLIEVREVHGQVHLFRWRFEWVGHSPVTSRSEEVSSPSQRKHLLQFIAEKESAAGLG